MNLPDRIVFSGPEGFEIDDSPDIQLVFEIADRLNVSPERAITLALVTQVDNDPVLRNDPIARRLADKLR